MHFDSRNRVFRSFWMGIDMLGKNPVSGHTYNLRNRVFRSFWAVYRYAWKKPGFWPHIQPKKPGFSQFLGGVWIFWGKNPVSGHTYNLRNRVFRSFWAVYRYSGEKTRFLLTPKIAKIEQRPNQKGDYCERFHHRTDIEIGIWARR